MTATSSEPHPAGARLPQAGNRVSLGLLCAGLSAASFGVSAPFARPAAEAGVSGADLILWRVGMLAVVLGIVALVLRRPLLPPRASWPGVVVFTLATVSIGVSYLSSIAFVPVGIAVLIFYTFPLIILLASPFVDRRRPTPAQLIAFVLAFAGLVLAIGPQWGALDPRGLALAALASVSAACQVFLGSRVGPRLDPLTFGFSSLALAAPLAFLAALLTGGPAGPVALGSALIPVLMIVLTFNVGYILQLKAMRLAPPSAVGLVFTVEPVIAIGTAVLLLGETLVATQYIGAALVLGALALTVLPAPAPRSAEPAR